MNGLRHLEAELAALDEAGLLRQPPAEGGAGDVDLRSNDYLGYAAKPVALEQAMRLGAGASRLVSGEHPAHRALERALSEWLGLEDALVFSSGYAANVGVISALARAGDVIVSDEHNHASIIDGCRLSRAEVVRVPHLDVAELEQAVVAARARQPQGRCWLVTESYFSMNGTTPDLAALRSICDQHDAALIVDEAHALGVLGPSGAGLCPEADMAPDVLVGTFGKALGLQGAFVGGCRPLRRWLWNRARSFVFSTGMSPWLAAAAHGRVGQVAGDQARRARLRALTERVRGRLEELGAPIASSHGPIIPWQVGQATQATALANRLRRRGVLVAPIRPPAVPDSQAILRISVHAGLTDAEVERALAAFEQEIRDR